MMIGFGNGDGLRGRSDVLMKVAQRGCTEFLMVSSQSLSENTHPKSICKVGTLRLATPNSWA